MHVAVDERIDAARAELYDRGLDDMLMLAEMSSVVSRHLDEPLDSELAVDATVDLIEQLLGSGHAIIGDVIRFPEGLLGVRSWGLNPSSTGDRIRREWRAIGRLEKLGEVCWLELTEEGRENARTLRAR
jgi:hypothetical protein